MGLVGWGGDWTHRVKPDGTNVLVHDLRTLSTRHSMLAGQGTPPAEPDYVFTTPSGRCLDINPLRERVWFPTLKGRGSGDGRCTRLDTRSRRTRSKRGSRRRGSPPCSGTPRPRCSSKSTPGSSRTGPAAMGPHSSRAWGATRGTTPRGRRPRNRAAVLPIYSRTM